ncbi:MAG: hypothetical protein IPF96_04560 [Rhodobacter sp.]|nr:hypothetical protein [Rhodobacter sp.]
MSLCVDLVLNHTAKEHPWAKKAAKGDAKYQDYYLMFDSPDLPNRFEDTLVEVFPDNAPGNFTHCPQIGGWTLWVGGWLSWHPCQSEPEVICCGLGPHGSQRSMEEAISRRPYWGAGC